MKKTIPFWPIMLMVIAVLGAITESCNPKEDKKPPVVVVPPATVDTVKHLGDSVLENKQMDEYSFAIQARRKPPKKPRPGDPPEPPVIPANGCLLIDFNGQVISGSMWNAGTFTVSPSGLGLAQEQEVLNKVISYYAVFNPYIVVTNSETVFNSYPQNKRRRCVLTTSWEWFGQSGGVAYINSFSWFDDTPCFVFTSLLNYSVKNISDATAHEFSHCLGNRHQSDWRFNSDGSCYKANEYLWGDLIMGASYNSPNPRWGIGPNSLGCTIIQNDTSVIFETLRK